VPGLFLTPKAGPFDYVTASLQGSRTNEILWLVDGVRISNRGFPDTVGGAPYVTSVLGVPRTLHLSYTFSY